MAGLSGLALKGLEALGFGQVADRPEEKKIVAPEQQELGVVKTQVVTQVDLQGLEEDVHDAYPEEEGESGEEEEEREEQDEEEQEREKQEEKEEETKKENKEKTREGIFRIAGSQRQTTTKGRIAGMVNKVRGGILYHNDKKAPSSGKIYSPFAGEVVSIESNYPENRKGRSLKKPNFGNYIVIRITEGPFKGRTYHLGHIDADIPCKIGDQILPGQHIANIKYGSGSGTGLHYSDAIGGAASRTMATRHHKKYVNLSAQLANITIQEEDNNTVAVRYANGATTTYRFS